MADNPDTAHRGRRIAVFLAGVGLFWILMTEIGRQYGWTNSTRALFDLMALAGFGWGLWMGIRLWRDRQNDEG